MCERCDRMAGLGITKADGDSTLRIRNFGEVYLLERQSPVPPFDWYTLASGSWEECIDVGDALPDISQYN